MTQRFSEFTAVSLATVLVVVSFGLFAYHTVPLLTFPVEVKYGEGVVLDQVRRVAEEPGLYPPFEGPPYLIDNYPPVYPLVVSLIPSPEGAPFFAGRLVSIASILVAAWMIGLLVRREAGDVAGLFATAIFLVTPEILDFGMRMRVDSLALAFGLIGIYATLSEKKSGKILGCVAFFLSIYTRHSMFVFPLAAYATLFLGQGRSTLVWPMGLLGSGILAFLLGNLWWSGGLYEHLISFNVLEYQTVNLWRWFGGEFPWRIPLIAAAALSLLPVGARKSSLRKGQWLLLALAGLTLLPIGAQWVASLAGRGERLIDPETTFRWFLGFHALLAATALLAVWAPGERGEARGKCRRNGLFLLLAFASAALIGRQGSDLNYLFELYAIFAILAGYALGSPGPRLRVVIASLLLAYFTASSIDYGRNKNTRPERLEQMKYKQEVVNHLRGFEGPILSLDPGVSVAAGHPLEYQPFMYRALANLQAWDPEPLAREVEEKRFAAVVWIVHSPVAFFEPDAQGNQVPHFAKFTWIAGRNFARPIREAVQENYELDPRLDRVIEKVNDLYFLGYEVWIPKKP